MLGHNHPHHRSDWSRNTLRKDLDRYSEAVCPSPTWSRELWRNSERSLGGPLKKHMKERPGTQEPLIFQELLGSTQRFDGETT